MFLNYALLKEHFQYSWSHCATYLRGSLEFQTHCRALKADGDRKQELRTIFKPTALVLILQCQK